MAPDQVSRLKIPEEMTGVVLPSVNPSGRSIFFAAREKAEDEGGKVMKSVEFRPVQTPSGKEVANFRFEKPEMDIVLRYNTESGLVVPSSFSSGITPLSSLTSAVSASDARSKLGVYWFNGKEYVKVFGAVNPEDQTITVRSALPGSYQIRSLSRAPGVSFGVKKCPTINHPKRRRRTTTWSSLDNPKDSSWRQDLHSPALVAEMSGHADSRYVAVGTQGRRRNHPSIRLPDEPRKRLSTERYW